MAKAQNVPSSLAGLFEGYGAAEQEKKLDSKEKIVKIPLDETYEFQNHPFLVVEDEKMEELIESIKEYGILTPGIARPRTGGGYEVISGHRRRYAAKLAGKSDMLFIVRDYTDDEAVIIMVDSNIQREDLNPSEKAKAYRMKYEAMKHQGLKGEKHTADAVGEMAGDSGRTVQRYIRLTYLLPELLELVDSGKLKFVVGVALSFFSEANQACILEFYNNNGIFPSEKQLRDELAQIEDLSYEILTEILFAPKQKKRQFQMSEQRIAEYFSSDYSIEEIEDIILHLLEEWREGQK